MTGDQVRVSGWRDPGLQAERTSLAWLRTVLGYLVVATIALRAASHSGPIALVSAAGYLGVGVAIAWRRAARHRSHTRSGADDPRWSAAVDVVALSAATGLLSSHWLWITLR